MADATLSPDQATNHAGGLEQPLVYGYCIAARNRTHLSDLAAVRKMLAHRM